MAIATHNVALIGFRATGKTTVGRALAAKLGWTFVDMDERLMTEFGADIQTWVQEHGWEAFRDAEARLLDQLAVGQQQVVATGGGVILRAGNRELLRQHFLVIWLQASASAIQARLSHDPKTATQRPPLTELSLQDEITVLLEERTPLYAATAHVSLDTDGQDLASLTALVLAQYKAEQVGPNGA